MKIFELSNNLQSYTKRGGWQFCKLSIWRQFCRRNNMWVFHFYQIMPYKNTFKSRFLPILFRLEIASTVFVEMTLKYRAKFVINFYKMEIGFKHHFCKFVKICKSILKITLQQSYVVLILYCFPLNFFTPIQLNDKDTTKLNWTTLQILVPIFKLPITAMRCKTRHS